LAETTDMASSDDGSDDNAPEVSETIVPKTDAPARPMFAALPDTKASMLGAADVTPTAERPEAAAADNTRAAAAAQADSAPVVTPAVAPGVAAPAPAVKPAVNSPQPAAKAATSTIVSAPRPAAAKAVPRTKVITASLTAPPAPAAAATSRTAAPAARAVEKAAAPIQRGTPPSSLAAQAAALKSPQRVAALAPAPFATGTPPPPGRFEIQIGAYASVAEAQKALNAVQARAGTVLASHPSVTQPINKDGRQVFRARFRGFDANSAANACGKLRQQSFDCFVMTAE
jgi:D-alanyl-D-alanine carboxypeptidase